MDRLSIERLSPRVVRRFLLHLEQQRGCSVSTRNQRLAAIHALARFIGSHSPEHLAWCGQIRAIPFKRAEKPSLGYLEKSEIDALLAAPDRRNAQGFRDYALLLFLYNTGARAAEAAGLLIDDLDLDSTCSVRITGKGRKVRVCPLWPLTLQTLRPLILGRGREESVFLNRRREPITRFGIYDVVRRHSSRVISSQSSLRSKKVSPHTIRHTTAVSLLRAGVDINTIRAWLGHVSVDTTSIYAEVDLEMKAKALACHEVPAAAGTKTKVWRSTPGLMAFLKAL